MRTESERLKSDFFGEARCIDIHNNSLKNKDGEIFFSIQRRGGDNKYIPQKDYGYLVKTDEMENFIYHQFFTGCDSIQFIQWEHEWNVVFDEKSIIGGVSFRMDFEEFDKVFGEVFAEKR